MQSLCSSDVCLIVLRACCLHLLLLVVLSKTIAVPAEHLDAIAQAAARRALRMQGLGMGWSKEAEDVKSSVAEAGVDGLFAGSLC